NRDCGCCRNRVPRVLETAVPWPDSLSATVRPEAGVEEPVARDAVPRASSRQRQAGLVQRRFLPVRQYRGVEIRDQVVKQPVPVDFGREMQKDAAQTDGGAVHEDEFARRRHTAQLPQLAVYLLRDFATVQPAFLHFLDAARTVLQQRRIDE